MSTLFLVFVAAIVVMLVAVTLRYLPQNYRIPTLIGLSVWIGYGGMLGYTGVISNTATLPPGILYLLVPIIVFVMFMARSNVGHTVALSIPLWMLMGMESFRFVVEIFLHRLWMAGSLPQMLTYRGANFDILIGMSAPVVAWLLATNRLSSRAALLWNVIGIAMLANVAARGVLTSPGPLHLIQTEVPNTAISTFPFTFIPGLMVPLALVLHVLSIRALRQSLRAWNTRL